jgi:alkaline phosphatase D
VGRRQDLPAGIGQTFPELAWLNDKRGGSVLTKGRQVGWAKNAGIHLPGGCDAQLFGLFWENPFFPVKRIILPLLACAGFLSGESIPLVNPSGEINGGTSPAPVAGAAVPGWDSNGGQVIRGGTDYGNGAWRLSFEDSEEIRQMTSHGIQSGASYSLRFDAAMGATGSSGETLVLIGGDLRNGNFNADVSATDSRPFENTPNWTNLGGAQTTEATRTNLALDGSRNAVVSESGTRIFANDTGHTLAAGELFRATYQWRDALNWNDASDRIGVALFTTSNNSITGTRTVIQTLLSATSAADSSYQPETANFAAIPAPAAGKRLFVLIQGVDGSGDTTGFARLDDFRLERVESHDPVDPVDPAGRVLIADLIVDNNGSPLTVATRGFTFKSPSVGTWAHYHLAVPAGALDAHAGKAVGIRFRSDDSAAGNFQSVDNVRLDFWPAGSPAGAFSDNWNTTPNQVWTGPGYWANRLHDWQVNNGRVNCIQSTRERRTLHRTGTSIRGNGGNFTLSVRTGIHASSDSTSARSGFLLGAAPNLDWRGALLVHDSLGRDFGLFLGLRPGGAVAIEDYSTGAVTTLAAGTAAAFTENSRLVLTATYLAASGAYSLKIESFSPANALLSTATASVPSDRVLGSFGLLSHRGTGDTRFWFDDFTGSGAALQPEPDRSLAIVGAMHTLSRGTLKLTAQLAPLSLVGNPQVFLDTWNGSAWQQFAAAPIDNTDNLSSYTATFKIPGWNAAVDTPYRVRIPIGGSDHTWTGTIRREPVDKNQIVVATTTCQRICDIGLETGSVDWTPVVIWHPHTLAFEHVAKHQPDVHFAAGDQIYESQPTPPDNSNDFNRHHDYLYKWYLWVLQARELAREVPTIAIPDDHDVYQGNLWGEGGIATTVEDTGGYRWPAAFVKMVERTQTSNLPDADPYNATQPAPPVAQGIGVYFTGMVYGRVGIAILEDRKFKTGKDNPPADLNQQHLLGARQHNFLQAWSTDWAGQDVKFVASQSPLGNFRTHAGSGYGFFLNDRDTHGWPLHRRNEAWKLLRLSRMFQLAGDQHLASVGHHGVAAPRDAGFSFTAPAISNFFPRIWDPVNNTSGITTIVSPYKGDFFFNGVGTLPDGVTPNRTASDPAHIGILAAGNSDEYYSRTLGISPVNLHDRAPGYGITRINKSTRQIVFEAWPLHADPEFPQTGGQYPDWPITIRQTDNDGRIPSGHLKTIDTQWQKNAVIRVFDESDNSLVYAMRVRGNLFRPPVYDNSKTYRIEIAYDDGPVTETHPALSATVMGPPAIHSFSAIRPSVAIGSSSTLRWDVSSAATLTIDHGLGDVKTLTVDGIGFLEVAPTVDTTYTLTLNGSLSATTSVRVFPRRDTWNATHFSPAELADPAISGGGADPDGDGLSNDEEYRFQTNPHDPASRPLLSGTITNDGGLLRADFISSYPLDASACTLMVESSADLKTWTRLPSNSFTEIARDNLPASGTSRITIRLNESLPGAAPASFYRAGWDLP